MSSVRAGLVLFILGGVLASLSACALFGFDEDMGFDVPIAATHSFDIPIDLSSLSGLPVPAGETAPTRIEQELPLPGVPVDLASASPDLNKNKDKLESVEITKIVVTPKTNQLTAPSPPIQLYIGPMDSQTADQAVLVATIPAIPAGSTAPQNGTIDWDGMDAAQQYIRTLQFSFIPVSTLVVEQGQEVPGGRADLELELTIMATVDPTK